MRTKVEPDRVVCVNPFLNLNEKANMYMGSVVLSFTFMSPDLNVLKVLAAQGIHEDFNDTNEDELRKY